jgi:hypothetical protein
MSSVIEWQTLAANISKRVNLFEKELEQQLYRNNKLQEYCKEELQDLINTQTILHQNRIQEGKPNLLCSL